MNKQLALGSLFDGSGGFPLGAVLNGITPLWASEIECFPIRVTTKRLPQMKHYGDIAKIDGAKVEPVDIITFGSPCTDMSVAGKRAGLDGKQSVLFYEAIRIIKEMRCATNGRHPRFILWENVPGAFSSNKGTDFKAVLESIVRIAAPEAEVPAPDKNGWPYADILVGNGWSVAYRTIDAQYFGVAQRRKRIYLVADFGSERAGEILFEPQGVSRDFATSFDSWQKVAGGFKDSAREQILVLNDQGGACMSVTEDLTATLRAQEHGHQPIVFEPGAASRLPKTYGICSVNSNVMKSANPNSGFYEAKTSRTLDKGGGKPTCNQGGMAVVETVSNGQNRMDDAMSLNGESDHGIHFKTYALQGNMIGREEKNGPQGDGVNDEASFTLNTVDRHAVAYSMTTGSFADAHEEKTATLMARDWKDTPIVNRPQYVVRRLTPTECARLQGFPDWWCDDLGTPNPTEREILWWSEVFETHRKIMGTSAKRKSRNQIVKWLRSPRSDSAEYKMWGNGICLWCAVFVLGGIVELAKDKQE